MSKSRVLCAVTYVNNVENDCSCHVDSTSCMTLNPLMLTEWVLCVRNIHTYCLKRVCIVSVYLGKDSLRDPEVALTAECEGNQNM
jgi:hypothetical protein